MHIQPEILSAAGVPCQLFDHGALILQLSMGLWTQILFIQVLLARTVTIGMQLSWHFLQPYGYLCQNLEVNLFQSPLLLHGQLAMVKLCMESLTHAVNSLCFIVLAISQLDFFSPNLFQNVTTWSQTAQVYSTFSKDQPEAFFK